jgi:hypothetical protein
MSTDLERTKMFGVLPVRESTETFRLPPSRQRIRGNCDQTHMMQYHQEITSFTHNQPNFTLVDLSADRNKGAIISKGLTTISPCSRSTTTRFK